MRTIRPLLVVLLAVVAGCAGGPAPSPSIAPSPAATIGHPTGGTDLVLRMNVGGGFVPEGFFLSAGPQVSLYGDGSVIVRATFPSPLASDGIGRSGPYLTFHMDEAAVDTLLLYAIGDGGLRAARSSYTSNNVADAPTTTFTIRADGLDRTVAVYALGIDSYADTPDAATIAALVALRDRLGALQATQGATPWSPDRYRGMLTDNPVSSAGARAWPWPDVVPADFVADPDVSWARSLTLSAAQVAALGVSDDEGGLVEVDVQGPDGIVYAFHLRPLWPDEAR